MKRSTLFPLAALVVGLSAAGAMVATAQTADTAPEAQMIPVQDGPMGGHMGGPGGRMGGDLLRQFLQAIDTDGNGAITQAEIDAFLAAKLAEADTSKDGSVDLAEFEPAFLAAIRPQMVDAFQGLDDDGDGKITQAELDARFGDAVARMDRNGDGALSRDDRAERGERGHRKHRWMMGPGGDEG